MSTTSLKLPDELKARTAAAAKARGMSTHAFMLNAVEQATSAAERREAFIQEGLKSLEDTKKSNKVYDGDEVLEWFRAKARGENLPKPKAKPWRA